MLGGCLDDKRKFVGMMNVCWVERCCLLLDECGELGNPKFEWAEIITSKYEFMSKYK